MVEQVIRPTGLVDPVVELQPRIGQMDNLLAQIRETTEKGYRTLVTVLTKKLAEELAEYLQERKIKVCYLHSDLKTPQRTELLHKLRLGTFDCLVGVNLLREGLDLPEVALVAIMDADVESYLRDKRSLIQTIGRAARNTESKVIMYCDRVTKSMRAAIEETDRRRALQEAHNVAQGITPETVRRDVTKSISNLQDAIAKASKAGKSKKKLQEMEEAGIPVSLDKRITQLEVEMQKAAQDLDFEKAIALRAQWFELQKKKA
jgi:excinuclease ABC subunit B